MRSDVAVALIDVRDLTTRETVAKIVVGVQPFDVEISPTIEGRWYRVSKVW